MIHFAKHRDDRSLLVVECVALAVLGIVAACLFAPLDALAVTVSLAVAYAIPRLVYARRPWHTTAGQWLLCAVSLVMVALAVLTIWTTTVALDLPMTHPHLTSDDGTYYRWAMDRYIGLSPNSHVTFPGFPMLMLVMFKLLGPSVVWPLAMNVMFTLLTLIVTAATTVRLLHGRVPHSASWLATAAICAVSVLMFFLSQGLRIQKEAMVYLGITLVGYVLAGMNVPGQSARWFHRRDLMLWTVGCLMMMLGRTTYLYFAILGLCLLGLRHWRTHWREALVMLAIVGVAFTLGNMIARYSIAGHMQIVGGGYYMQNDFLKSDSTVQPYLDLVGRYFYFPIWQRVALLPLTCSVQFIIPFPWLYSSPSILSIFPRLAWGWYAVGGVALYYYACLSWRRGIALGVWAWWPAIIYVIIAYVFAGTVSRYVLPVQPLVVPLVVYVLSLLLQHRCRKSFTTWAIVYVIVLVAALVVCYHIQIEYLNHVETYYRAIMRQ
ncbi:MAG: hypothetical protein IJ775_02390 [Muribaculaceae bacterium]|nr:hypothetical protein [Muribaculaceae bacterium]